MTSYHAGHDHDWSTFALLGLAWWMNNIRMFVLTRSLPMQREASYGYVAKNQLQSTSVIIGSFHFHFLVCRRCRILHDVFFMTTKDANCSYNDALFDHHLSQTIFLSLNSTLIVPPMFMQGVNYSNRQMNFFDSWPCGLVEILSAQHCLPEQKHGGPSMFEGKGDHTLLRYGACPTLSTTPQELANQLKIHMDTIQLPPTWW